MDFSILTPFFSVGIFLIAFLSLLLVGFQQMLKSVKTNQTKLENDIESNKQDLKEDIDRSTMMLQREIESLKKQLKSNRNV